MANLRLFGPAREAAGVGKAIVPGKDVAEVLEAARGRYGTRFATVVASSRVWLNGEIAELDTPVGDDDEVAVLPPVSGG
ncbi:MAG TPA: MoaD/ThiS family protein [Acidimicrobiales bacterium]|jgi:molybdopterin converting factor small subunit